MSKKDSKSKGINPTNYADIPAFVPGDTDLVHAVIETPRGIRHKYAFEPKYGIMLLKQTLAEGLAWPYDYGFVPQTLGDDGDPLDILVLNDTALFSGALQRVRLIGGVLLKKNGEENDRLIGCPPQHGERRCQSMRFTRSAMFPTRCSVASSGFSSSTRRRKRMP